MKILRVLLALTFASAAYAQSGSPVSGPGGGLSSASSPNGTINTSLSGGSLSFDVVPGSGLANVLDNQNLQFGVDLATTDTITLSGVQTVDGQSATNGKVVAVWHQSSTTANGIYTVNGSGAWVRTGYILPTGSLGPNCSLLFTVKGGNTLAGHVLSLDIGSGVTVGSSPLNFTDITYASRATTTRAGAVYLAATSAVQAAAVAINPYTAAAMVYNPCVTATMMPNYLYSGTVATTMGLQITGVNASTLASYGPCATIDGDGWPTFVGEGTGPSVSSCGTGTPTVVNTWPLEQSSDQVFHVTGVASGTTSCKVTFAFPKYHETPPVCVGTTSAGSFVGQTAQTGAASTTTTTSGTTTLFSTVGQYVSVTNATVTVNVASTSFIAVNANGTSPPYTAKSVVVLDPTGAQVTMLVTAKTSTSITGYILLNASQTQSLASGVTVGLYQYWDSVTLSFPNTTTDFRAHCV